MGLIAQKIGNTGDGLGDTVLMMSRWLYVLVAIGLLAPSRADARMMVHYDLAGLLMQSDAVVIADRIGPVKTPEGEYTRYRVVKSLRGSRKAGDLVQVYDAHFSTTGHKLDTQAVLFVMSFNGTPNLVSSGLRVLENGKVWRFEQQNNPGPFDMVPQGRDPQDQWGLGGRQLDLAGLERAIADAQQRIDAVAAAKSIVDPAKRRTAVLAVFPKGTGASGFYVDLLAERARTQLVDAGDLEGALLVDARDRGMTFRSGSYAKLPDLVAIAIDPKRTPEVRRAALAVAGRGFALSDNFVELDRIATLIDDPDPGVRAAAIATAAQPAQVITSDRAQQRKLDAYSTKIRTAIAKRYGTEQDARVIAAILAVYDGAFRRSPPSRATGPRIVAVPNLANVYVGVDVYCVRPSKITNAEVILMTGATRVPTGAVNAQVHCGSSVSVGGGTGAPPAGTYELSIELAVQGSGKVTLPLGRLIVDATGDRLLD